jgi:hypothetical protein
LGRDSTDRLEKGFHAFSNHKGRHVLLKVSYRLLIDIRVRAIWQAKYSKKFPLLIRNCIEQVRLRQSDICYRVMQLISEKADVVDTYCNDLFSIFFLADNSPRQSLDAIVTSRLSSIVCPIWELGRGRR